jgi:hypothetical protein
MSEVSFDRVISEHLALCERNKRLGGRMPLDPYREDVNGGAPQKAEPESERAADAAEHWLDHESFWDTSRERPMPEFDWGDD